MKKQKVFIAIHQLNIGGAQKALISALNAIDYSKNDVTLYVRKKRLDLLPFVNKNVQTIIINEDDNRYDYKPYSLCLTFISRFFKLLNKDTSLIDKKNREYILKKQFNYEKKHYFSDGEVYDIAISYIQSYTAKFVVENVSAKRKIMFYHDSTDSLHGLHVEIMKHYDCIYCVSKPAMEAVKGFYPEFAEKIFCLENYVDYKQILSQADEFIPD